MYRRFRDQYCRPHALQSVPSTTALYCAQRRCVLKKCAPSAALVRTALRHGLQIHGRCPAVASGLRRLARQYSPQWHRRTYCSSLKRSKSLRLVAAINLFILPGEVLHLWCRSGHAAPVSSGSPGSAVRSHCKSVRTAFSQACSSCRTAQISGGPALMSEPRRLNLAFLAKTSRAGVSVRMCTAGAARRQ